METATVIYDKSQLLVVGWVLGVFLTGCVSFLASFVSLGVWPLRYVTKEAEKSLP